MNNEKVKEIKKALECMSGVCKDATTVICWDCKVGKKFNDETACKETLNLINELESENERLLGVIDIANEREYRKKFNDEWRQEYQKELDKQGNGYIAGYPDFDLVYKLYFEQKDRIAELEKGNDEQYKRIMELEQDLVHADENVFFRECNVTLRENEIKQQAIKQFAEKVAKRLININGIKQILDETLKEFINES